MKGLIIKDFLFMKTQFRILTLLFVFYLLIMVIGDATSIFSMLSCILIPLMAASCASYDDSVNWNRFACSLPVSRKQIVKSRYASLLILLIAFELFALIVTFVYATVKKTSTESTFLSIVVSFAVSLLSTSALVPLLIKFGAEKARIIMMIFVVLPMALAPMLTENGVPVLIKTIPDIPLPLILIGILIFLLLCLIASYFISVKIYMKKDF